MKSVLQSLALASTLLIAQNNFAAVLVGQFQAVDAGQGRGDYVRTKFSTTGCATYKFEPTSAALGAWTYTLNLYDDRTFTLSMNQSGGMPSAFISGDWAPINAQQTQFRLIPSGNLSGANGTDSWDTLNTRLSQSACLDESYSGINHITAKYPASIKILTNTLTRSSHQTPALGYAGSLSFSFEESVKTLKVDNAKPAAGNYPKARYTLTMKGYWNSFTPANF